MIKIVQKEHKTSQYKEIFAHPIPQPLLYSPETTAVTSFL